MFEVPKILTSASKGFNLSHGKPLPNALEFASIREVQKKHNELIDKSTFKFCVVISKEVI